MECPACAEVYGGLEVAHSGALILEQRFLQDPFVPFALAAAREAQREVQFMQGICGSGWKKRPGVTMCALHTAPVPRATLLDYWDSLPDDHRRALFSMREEDFVAELDGHMRYHLKICRDCRLNVMRSFRDVRGGENECRLVHAVALLSP